MWITSVLLLSIVNWSPSSATGGQTSAQLDRISAWPTENGEGKMMRLRTCRDDFMVQCGPCEVIRIVNASYAANRERQRNPNEGCSDISFQHEFDCLHSANSRYLEEITKSCDGMQSCELRRGRSSFFCGSLSTTWSCCMEIYYTCETKNDQIESALFLAIDTSGNVNNVSFQCQSSDLSVESVVLAFNSSGEFHEGGVCYKESPNTNSVKRRCERRGCTATPVAGARGCGRDKYVYNYGVYVCYTCKSGKPTQTTDVTAQSSAFGQRATEPETMNQSSKKTESSSQGQTRITRQSPTTIESVDNIETHNILRIVVFASLIGALLVSLFVGCIVYANRKRNRAVKLISTHMRKIPRGNRPETTPESKASGEEQEDYSFPDRSPVCLQLDGALNGQYNATFVKSGLQRENECLDTAEIKVQAQNAMKTCEVWCSVLYENLGRGEEANKSDLNSSYVEVTNSRDYWELPHVNNESLGKDLEPVYAEPKNFRKDLEQIHDPEDSNPDYVNSGKYREDLKTVYDTLERFGSYQNPVYDQLNLSNIDDIPVHTGK